MTMQSIISCFVAKLRLFRSASGANVTVMFAVALVPIAGAIGAAVDYGQANSIKVAMQAAADAAALGSIKTASTQSAAQVQSYAAGLFNATFNRPQATPAVSASYDAASNTVTVSASATFKPNIMPVVGISHVTLSVTSKATIGAKMWQVCVMVTDPTSSHTLLVKNGSTIDFTNCMVQVNTANWDAVEARDTSYIHSTNGDNCFVGDIHYGDVTPPKDPTCTMFTDPFASFNVPTNTCTYTNKVVNTAGTTTLTPGTYCGGINISQNVTFSPGLYYIQNGDLTITGSANVTANNVTFLITGANSNLNITTKGTLTMSPNTDAAAGQWAGFLVYYDQPSAKNNKAAALGKNFIQNATLNGSGIIYLVNQTLNITNGATVTINPGSIIADMILPDSGGSLNLTGTLNSPLAVLNSMKKTGATSGGPILVN
jgi:Flp pilus assembly protein TadG